MDLYIFLAEQLRILPSELASPDSVCYLGKAMSHFQLVCPEPVGGDILGVAKLRQRQLS